MLGWKGKVGVGAKPTAMDYRKALNSLDPSKVSLNNGVNIFIVKKILNLFILLQVYHS